MTIFGKSLKKKIWTNFEYFLPRKIRNGKFLKNLLEKWKNLVKSVKK